MSMEEFVLSNVGRVGKNLMNKEGPRKGTVVLKADECTTMSARFWGKDISIITTDIYNGRSTCFIPPEFFNVESITKADKQEEGGK